MIQPAPPQQLPADQVIDALTSVHAEIQGKLTSELAQLRVVVRMRDDQVAAQAEEIAYLKSLAPTAD